MSVKITGDLELDQKNIVSALIGSLVRKADGNPRQMATFIEQALTEAFEAGLTYQREHVQRR